MIERIARWIGDSPDNSHKHVWAISLDSTGRRTHSDLIAGNSVQVDATVCETPLNFGDRGQLFGILSEPRERSTARGRLGVILLNTGADYHIVPSRLYVSIADRWANVGYTVLRFDLSGLGDSPAAEGCEDDIVPPQTRWWTSAMP